MGVYKGLWLTIVNAHTDLLLILYLLDVADAINNMWVNNEQYTYVLT